MVLVKRDGMRVFSRCRGVLMGCMSGRGDCGGTVQFLVVLCGAGAIRAAMRMRRRAAGNGGMSREGLSIELLVNQSTRRKSNMLSFIE